MARKVKSKRGRRSELGSRIGKARLKAMVEEATVDCYNESEEISGWFTMIDDHLAVPFGTTVLGMPVTVKQVALDASGHIVAICARGRDQQAVPILNLPLPLPLPGGAEWITAYSQWVRGG
jgi:hypothetical protein